jgi:aspartate aminotransferase
MACPSIQMAKAVSAMQGHTTSNACSFAQYASACAISGGEDFIDGMVKEFDSRRKLLVKGLSEIDGIKYVNPKGAFYVFANVSAYYGKSFDGEVITGSVSFANAILKCGVAVIPGLAFGDDESIRLSYTLSSSDILAK